MDPSRAVIETQHGRIWAVEFGSSALKRCPLGIRRWIRNELELSSSCDELIDEEWVKWSDRKIAEAAAVSNNFVGDVRREVSSDDTSEEPRVGKDGKQLQESCSSSPAAKSADKPRIGKDDVDLNADPDAGSAGDSTVGPIGPRNHGGGWPAG